MQIQLQGLSKRYQYEWIFKSIDYTFESGKSYAIIGPNGAGKSTLMRTLSGHLSPTKGKIVHSINDKTIASDVLYQHLTYAAPYIDLIEEFSLQEQLKFHQKFKPFLPQLSVNQLIKKLAFKKSKNKLIRHFSSGMKQRLKLILAICSSADLVLLDEPTTNLDRQGVEWYLDLIETFRNNRTIIIASNVEEDYKFCDDILSISDYKQQKS